MESGPLLNLFLKMVKSDKNILPNANSRRRIVSVWRSLNGADDLLSGSSTQVERVEIDF